MAAKAAPVETPHTGGAPAYKVGACYNIFDGEELLEASIKSIMSVLHMPITLHFPTRAMYRILQACCILCCGCVPNHFKFWRYKPSEQAG